LRQVEGSNRWITKIRLTFDGHRSREVALDESSHTEGTTIDLGDERFSTLRITILETDPGEAASYKPFSTVGFSEAHLGTLAPTTEWIRPPRDLITAVGERSASHELAYVFERQASSPDSGAADEEDRLLRIVDVPTARAFTPQVKVRLNPNAPDNQLDSLLGIGGVSATASSGLRYDSWWRASKVLDDEDTTGWTSALEPTMPQWVDFALPAPVTTEARSITVLADGRHSVPTAIHFEVDGVEQPRITLPTVADGPENHREILSFDPVVLTGTHIRLVIDAIREVRTPEWFSGNPSLAPVTVTNLDAATLHESRTEAPPALDCRNDLISMDSVPVPLRIQQSTAEQWRGLEMGAPLTAAPCEATSTLALSAGEHRLSTPHVTDGVLAVDAARLTSPAGAAGPEASAPKLAVTRDSRTSYMIRPKSNAAAPYWLVLGQSFNDGWSLEANGRDLGPPQLVNGYANGWRIDPADVGDATIRLRWKPQSFVWLALGLSGVGFVLCCALALRRPRASTRTIPRPTVVRLISPFDAFGQPPSLISGLGAVAAAAFVGGFFLGPLWAPVIGAAIAAALWTNTGWRALRLGVIAGLVLGAAYVVVQQWRVRYSLDFDWPAHFDRVHWLVMACYVLLACETLVEALRAGWRRDANFEE
jgi:arabinofuranan 3-O-arabinosyltransferase